MSSSSASISRRTVIAGGLVSAAALTLAACGSKTGLTEKNGVTTISIGATPKPHVEILQWVQDNLTEGTGIKLDIVSINDYQTPNTSLNDGSLAANFFQTPNFLAQQNKDKGYSLVSIANVHIEPMGIYTSKGYKDVQEIQDGGTIILNNDPANTARGLKLLAAAGLIELDKSAELPSDTDVTSNPKNLKFKTVDGAQVYRSMPDGEAAIINGNYAIDAKLNPKEDSLFLEKGGKDSEYPNQLVVRKDDKDNEHLKKLAKLLNDEKLREYITTTWPNEAVIPAF
ncbi:MetQ/NlpA family ABC transporter substrate-binding protein [Actinomyces johnsonii]|uniref:MetQ/NlpA family ABC transporter substrate-binding protein n=1 Tax=Actinomyces johnsonii TaxID=544581 RepID=UPI0028D28FB8|nr:MetQ/NlpA family ABC transporter substrate-binding protein [Actinomyces johnsonii]